MQVRAPLYRMTRLPVDRIKLDESACRITLSVVRLTASALHTGSRHCVQSSCLRQRARCVKADICDASNSFKALETLTAIQVQGAR